VSEAKEASGTLYVIEAGRSERHYWADLWRYRELFGFLVWRDILVRYKQTTIGVAWALLRPLVSIVVFTIVFGKLAGLPSDGVPYPILVCAGLLPWQFFAGAFAEAGGSLVGNASIISKVHFPRLVIPASAVIVSLIDFAISLLILAGLMMWYGYPPDWRIAAMPIFVVLAFAAAFGAGLWVGALNVRYRDFRYIVPFIIQFGIYISPVVFTSSIVPAQWRLAYSLNPMAGVIDGFRWTIVRSNEPLYWPGLAVSFIVTVILLATGLWYFRRTERSFADII